MKTRLTQTLTHTHLLPQLWHNFNVHFNNALKAFYHTYLMLFLWSIIKYFWLYWHLMYVHFMYDQCDICMFVLSEYNLSEWMLWMSFVEITNVKVKIQWVFKSIYHEKAFSFLSNQCFLCCFLLLNCFHVFCYVFAVYFFRFLLLLFFF